MWSILFVAIALLFGGFVWVAAATSIATPDHTCPFTPNIARIQYLARSALPEPSIHARPATTARRAQRVLMSCSDFAAHALGLR